MIPNRKQQLFHLTTLRQARIQAKAPQSPVEKAGPITLKSLKDARDQIKRTRPESVMRMSESYSKIDLINEELRRRSVFSLSPTASSELVDLSPPVSERLYSGNDECKEGSPAPVFADTYRPDLPEICENNVKDEGDEEKVQETKRKKEESKESKGGKKNGISKVLPISNQRPVKRVLTKAATRVTRMGLGKGKNEDVLEFMEETKLKKKLTKSQERVLLDRLQGFSTKMLSSNK